MKYVLALATIILTSVYLVAIAATELFQEVVPDMSMDASGQITKGEYDESLLKH